VDADAARAEGLDDDALTMARAQAIARALRSMGSLGSAPA